MSGPKLKKIEAQFEYELKLAKQDEIKIAMAKKLYYLRKMGYVSLNESAVESLCFNENRNGSYHPWSGRVIGEAFGKSGLKEFITLKEYMETSEAFDDILKGAIVGARKLAEENAAAAAKAAAKLKGKSNEYAKMANDIIDKGKS